MDLYKAKQLEQTLKKGHFLEYTIIEFINNGKSAAVFKAMDSTGYFYAIKIFDNDLVEGFGHEIQERRIEQEIKLKGHDVSNLVKIIDGGKTQIETNEYFYIIMEFISGENLKQFIARKSHDNLFIKRVVEVLFNVTELLLSEGVVHRDIKPENIMIRDDGEIILMDLGVLKLIGAPSFSDQDEKQFVGTLRYAPPEFLTRTEEDSITGWRAVNLYQIGGVLHDLIMKAELFLEYIPYSNLVLAIKEDSPKITDGGLPFLTVQLARDLLVKDWKRRLEICSKDRIEAFLLNDSNNLSSIDKELDDVLSMTSGHKAKFDEIEKIQRSNKERLEKRKVIASQVEQLVFGGLEFIQGRGFIQKFMHSKAFNFQSDVINRDKYQMGNYLCQIEGDITRGFPRPLYILVVIKNDENSLVQISLLAMFLSPIVKIDMSNPRKMFDEIAQELARKNPRLNTGNMQNGVLGQNGAPFRNVSFRTYLAFDGIIGFDQQFKDQIALDLIKIIKVALKGVSDEVANELERKENFAKGVNAFVTSVPETKLFYSI